MTIDLTDSEDSGPVKLIVPFYISLSMHKVNYKYILPTFGLPKAIKKAIIKKRSPSFV